MRKENTENYEYPEQHIVPVEMKKEVEQSFIEYAMSVIVARALPDVRDGLKPVHRRIIYAMYEDKLTYDRPFRKSATTVGNVLGRYHPHGDSAVYETMVRLAQNFSMRYPLVEGHGNFGNIDGDQAAAYRYTEARLARIAEEMTRDIEKDVVPFTPNFDNKLKEPEVLPARYPNLLVNGSIGIAVGMATYVPPHNLGEVIDGTIALMNNPDITIPELMEYIKGPDFPTYATIYGSMGIREAYTTGRGKVMVRARAEVDEENRRIIITEIPYQVNKADLVQAMANCVNDKRVEGVTDIRDETGRDGLRIVVEYRRDANGHVILNKFYKYTQLQDTCAINMLALVDGVPKVLNLKQILEYYVAHQESVISNRVRFELKKALHDAHINEGYKIAIDNIDEVISIIRASGSIPEAKEALMARFVASDVANITGETGGEGLSNEQAQAIVEMPLGRLAGMERNKVEEKLDGLHASIRELNSILADENKVKAIIRDDLLEIKRRYGDERRTELVPVENEIVLEDLIERHTCVITMTRSGYIKRLASDTYSAQRRGGKGIIGMATKEEDLVEHVAAVDSHSFLLLFTNKGKVYLKKAYQIPEASRTAKGTNIVNVIEIEPNESVTAMISIAEFSADQYLTMVTRKGVAKRTALSEYENCRRGGKRAISLDEGDELVFVANTDGNENLIIATANGYAVRFEESDVREMGRTARGVRGIRLTEGDYVVGCAVCDEDKKLITITQNGYGKRSELSDFSCHNRGGKGVHCHNINEKTGLLAGIGITDAESDIMLITNEGTMIRTSVAEIPVYSRSAGGVIVMRPAEGSYIANFALVTKEDEDTASDNEAEPVESEDKTEDMGAEETIPAEEINSEADNNI